MARLTWAWSAVWFSPRMLVRMEAVVGFTSPDVCGFRLKRACQRSLHPAVHMSESTRGWSVLDWRASPPPTSPTSRPNQPLLQGKTRRAYNIQHQVHGGKNDRESSGERGRCSELRGARVVDHDEGLKCPFLSPSRQRSSACSAARTVFSMSMAMVMGPTPPGTGDNHSATSLTAGSTSPARRHPVLWSHRRLD